MRLRAWLAAAILAAAPTFAPARMIGPSPYLSLADSPFALIAGLIVEDFEDGLLNTAGASVNGTWHVAGPGVFTDSVDADDGGVDGSGLTGHSLYSNGVEAGATFTFDAAALGGRLPTHAGIVWTDVGNVTSGTTGTGGVTFSAFDASDTLIGTIGPAMLGDGVATGGTAEDRFFGVIHAAGIKRITMTMNNSTDWEVDHLQYSIAAVPEPASFVLAAVGGLLLALRRLGVRRFG